MLRAALCANGGVGVMHCANCEAFRLSPFTDEDLRTFKNGEMSYTTFEEKTSALIARLEAAEDYANFRLRFSFEHDGEEERLQAWRKAAGK